MYYISYSMCKYCAEVSMNSGSGLFAANKVRNSILQPKTLVMLILQKRSNFALGLLDKFAEFQARRGFYFQSRTVFVALRSGFSKEHSFVDQ